MGGHTTKDIRSIVFVGHGGTGKTMLCESILFKTGMTTRMGRTTDRNTVSDFDVEERNRQVSIDLSVLHADTQGKRFYLLDSPGYADFIGNAVSGLVAADVAALVITAVNGIEVGARKSWQLADKMAKPRCIIINKTDAEHTRIPEILEELRSAFGNRCIPVNIPDAEGPSFSKVVDVLSPQGNEDYRTELFEAVVEADEVLMEQFLETMELAPEDFERVFPAAMAAGSVIPVFFTSADKGIGITEFVEFAARFFPDPTYAPALPAKGPKDAEITVPCTPSGPFAARVFRIQTDPFVGKLTFFKVIRGSVKSNASVQNTAADAQVKLAHIFTYQGKDSTEIESAVAGDIVVVSRIDALTINSSLCDPAMNNLVEFAPIPFPNPMVSLAMEPKSRGDEQKISTAVAKASEEDPTFRSERLAATKELVIYGMGELHLEVIISRMKRRFDVEVTTKLPRIPYLETITATAEAHYRHKKQTGGAGQFGEVYIRVEPNERGAGLEFLDEIVGGVVPRQFIPAVEKGVREAMEFGIIAGYTVVDVKVALYDGKYHPVDSKEIAFKIAGRGAFNEAFEKARPVLLEPIAKVSIFVPERCFGDVTGDLTSRRGRILGMDSIGGMQVVNANVPMSEIQRYSTELRSTTQGEGYYEMEFSHYDVVPGNLAQAIIERSKIEREKEKAD